MRPPISTIKFVLLLNHNFNFVLVVHVRHNQSKLCFCAHLITTLRPLTHLLLATREAQYSSAHSRPIAKDFVDGRRLFYHNLFTIDNIDTTLQVIRLGDAAACEVVNCQL